MNDTDIEQMDPQNFLYGCELKAGKEVVFNPSDDDFQHQLSLRMVCVDPSTKDELHIVEVEGRDKDGETVKAVLATLKPSTLPSVSLGGFEITPPAVFRLKSGSGPVHISGQHLVLMDGDQSFDEDDDDEEEEEMVKGSTKRPAPPTASKSQKKMKMEEENDEDEDDEESEEEETPVKPKKTPVKVQTPAQNGKTPSTPAGKPNAKAKTPDSKGKDKKPQTPRTPKPALSLDEIKAKLLASVQKGVNLPKVEAKFENFVKNTFHVADAKVIQELWNYRQTVKDRK
uniref:Nucleophosmin n=1 Tax=Scleropages formosus TaxID=113540 RepID=A0A8C9RB93_SCLFO